MCFTSLYRQARAEFMKRLEEQQLGQDVPAGLKPWAAVLPGQPGTLYKRVGGRRKACRRPPHRTLSCPFTPALSHVPLTPALSHMPFRTTGRAPGRGGSGGGAGEGGETDRKGGTLASITT